jgi:hypothetical protein
MRRECGGDGAVRTHYPVLRSTLKVALMTDPELFPKSRNRRTIPSTCRTHGGRRGFCNLRLTKIGTYTVLDPHVTGSCVIELNQDQATAVRDTLTEWLR